MSAERPSEVESLTTAHCSSCGHQVRHHETYPYLDGVVCKTRHNKAWCECPLNRYEALLASDWLADHDARVRAERDREWVQAAVALALLIEQGIAAGLGGDRAHTLANVATRLRRLAPDVAGEGA